MNLGNLLNALESLAQERKIIEYSSVFTEYDELTKIMMEVFEFSYKNLGLRGIEQKISKAMQIDLSSLESGVNLIKKFNPQNFDLRSGEKVVQIIPAEIINELDDFIEKIKNKEIERVNALFGLELFFDSNFDRLLMAFGSSSGVFDELKILLISKFEKISNDEMLLFWARLKASFSNNESKKGYSLYEDIIPDNFFSSDVPSFDVRDKCAILLAKYRPLTIRRMVEEGVNFFPITSAGVASILAMSESAEITLISNLEILLILVCSQIAAVYSKFQYKKSNDLAKAIGADENGLIFGGEFFKGYQNKIQNKHDKYELLVLNVKRLIEYVSLRTKKDILIEEALVRYKMGQEIIVPSRKKEFLAAKKTLEVYLQKDMCKYLIDHGILSFGRQSGRNEIDLYHKDIGGEEYIIESKVFKGANKLTLSKLKRSIVQLQSYMDHINQPRGILALYNFTDTVIIAPKKWLKGRLLIVCINLCDLPPSKRNSSIEIIESESEVIDLIPLDNNVGKNK